MLNVPPVEWPNSGAAAFCTTVNDEVVKLRDLEHVTAVVATHQMRDAFYVATHEAVRTGDEVTIAKIEDATATRAEFMVLHEGRITFEGLAAELLASTDPYLQQFLYKTLPPW